MPGPGVTAKLAVLAAVPPAVATLIVPVAAPAGTAAVMDVSLPTEKVVAVVPLNMTAVAPVKPVPVRITEVATPPRAGAKLAITGAGITVKTVEAVQVPLGVVTLILPVVAPAGTIAVMEVALTTENFAAAMPLKETAVAPVNEVPVIVTMVPTPLLAGVKLLTVGAGGALLPPPPPPHAAMTRNRTQARRMAPATRTDPLEDPGLQSMMAPEKRPNGHSPKATGKAKR